MAKRASKDIAECVSITDPIQVQTTGVKITTKVAQAPYNCTPGNSSCQYLKNGALQFELPCECGLLSTGD